MAKMFYSVEETAEILGKSVDQVKGLVASGQLKEFRDRDKLIFKKEQVDELAKAGDEDSIPLADSKGGSGLSLAMDEEGGSGSGPGMQIEESPKEKSGISIFDTEELDSADPSAVTQVSNTGQQELTMESVGSGSGLLDLTREGDDTSLGADLLEDVYQGEEGAAPGGEGDTQAASGLFETTTAASDVSSAAALAGAGSMMVVVAEPYDGAGSGLVGGFAFGTIAVLLFALTGVLLGIVGVLDNPVTKLVASNFWMWIGIFAVVVLVCAGIGWLLGKKSG